ncbi:MAG: DJ-1/PfpI family protein [Nanoarchaeota archaeon]|nr:DJ-1/PfpI family protein [Nanoarchaeota archaeon]
MAKILIPLSKGFDELEAIVSINILKRAGLSVVTAGLPGTMIQGSHGLNLTADRQLKDINPDDFDAMVLVSGDPANNIFLQSKTLTSMVTRFNQQKKLLAAIDRAPIILAKCGILHDKRATVAPGMERELTMPRSGRIVVDGNIITAQGSATAIDFALKLVEELKGKAKAARLREDLGALPSEPVTYLRV